MVEGKTLNGTGGRLAIVGLALLLRLPFLNQAIQGDDVIYLSGAQHAQIDPLHPTHATYLYLGELVSMTGHSHGPLNSWILAALLAVAKDVREIPFHLAYSLFSVIAALAMWSIAKRFCDRPFFATLLFLAVPAFVVNGNSLESDVPFLAMWLSAIALFIGAVDRNSMAALAGSAAAGALAGLTAYQGIFLVPLLALYLIEHRKPWIAGWIAAGAAPAALAIWQLYENLSGGRLPAVVLAGYIRDYDLGVLAHKVTSAVGLVVHSGWMVSPVIVLAAFLPGSKWRWIVAAVAAAGAAFYNPNPLFWISFGCGVLVLVSCIGRGFLGTWILIFFACAVAVFYAGSARYLLPIAAPVAILAVQRSKTPILIAGFVLQMILSLGLTVINYQHWDGYREFAASLAKQAAGHRVWINADWGLRFYLESEGGLQMPKNQVFQPGDMIVTSELSALPVTAALASIAQAEIRPAIPLRIFGLNSRSAYSVAGPHALFPFDVSRGPIDRVRAEVVIERKPELTYFDPRDPRAAQQVISGLSPDGWMGEEATVLLKRSVQPASLRVVFRIVDQSPSRHVRMLVDGQLVAEDTFPRPGDYTLLVPRIVGTGNVTVTVAVDKTFKVPPDQRKLSINVTGIGFR